MTIATPSAYTSVHNRVYTERSDLICSCVFAISDCAICVDGYTSSIGYQCTACNGTTDNATIAIIVLVATILVMVCTYIVKDLWKLEERQHNLNCFYRLLHSIVQLARKLPWKKLRVPLVLVQLLTQFVSITGTQYPSIYSNYLKWLNVVNLDATWLLSAGCVVHVNFYHKLLVATITPLLISAVIGAIHL
jgi:hypothetical protein